MFHVKRYGGGLMVEPKVQLLTSIDDVFAEQKRYSIELRESDYEARLAVLERFENLREIY